MALRDPIQVMSKTFNKAPAKRIQVGRQGSFGGKIVYAGSVHTGKLCT